MRFLLLLALLAAASPPKPKPAKFPVLDVQGLAACPATGNCRVILSWVSPPSYVAATDTARVAWLQTSPTATTVKADHAQRGTADTLSIPRPGPGLSKSGPVNLCHVRANWTGKACNAALTWTVTAPITPPDTATGLQLSAIIVTPSSLTVVPGSSQLLCAVARWSDGSTSPVVPWPAACDSPLGVARAQMRG